MKSNVKDFFLITIGTLVFSVGLYFFKFPNHFCMGGVSGISVVLNSILPEFGTAKIMLIINIVLLAFAFCFVGKDFGVKSVYCTMLMSLSTYGLELICPINAPLTSQPVLELILTVFLPAVGGALVFNCGASTGGTDIVAMIIKKHSNLNITKALFAADVVIVMLSLFAFGLETWLFSMIGFIAKVFLMDNVIESLNMSKYCTIITNGQKDKEIADYITKNLHRGVTYSKEFEGAFTDSDRSVLLTVVRRGQAAILKNKVKEMDNDAFIIITNTSDIIGNGFRERV